MATKAPTRLSSPGTATFEHVDRPTNLGNPQMGWNSDTFAEMVRRLDFKYLALVPGASYRGFHDSVVNFLGNSNPQMLVCLHEEHAVAIAHGYAKVTDEPMAVALHTNVGLMHGCMAVFNAWCDRKPMVIFGANGPMDADKRRPWIEWIHTSADQGALVRDYTKWDDAPRSVPAALESILRANQISRTPPFGPTYVCFDEEIQEQKLDGPVTFPSPERYRPGKPQAPRSDEVSEMADILLAAKRPVIMAGRALRDQDAWDRRVRLAEMLGAVVMTDLHNSAAFPSDHPLHVLEPRFHPRDQHLEAFTEADAILSLEWMDLGGWIKRVGGAENVAAKVIHVSIDSYVHRGWSMDYHILPCADLRVLASADATVTALIEELERRSIKGSQGQKLRLANRSTEKTEPVASGRMALRDMALYWRDFHRANDDVSMISMPLGWPGDCVPIRGPLDFLGSNGGAGIGAGPGIAVGAALALKDTGRLPVAVVGDGDFVMGSNAIWTAAHMDIPLLFVVANNQAYYNDVDHQERVAIARKREPANKWIGQFMTEPAIDLEGLARSYGFDSATVEDATELPAALEKAAAKVRAGGRFLLNVRVTPGYAE